MSSLFDLPIQEVDLVFPSYQRLIQSLVDLVHHLHARRKFDHTLLQLNWHYGHLLSIEPNFLRFADHPLQAAEVLKQLERDMSAHGLLSQLRHFLQNETTLWVQCLSLLGFHSPKAKNQAVLLHTIGEIEKSFRAICKVWAGREVQRPKVKVERRKKHSTYLVLSSLAALSSNH